MLTKEAETYAALGRAWERYVNFDSIQPVTDPEALAFIQQALQKGRGRKIIALANVTQSENGTFRGEFQQYVNPQLTKRFEFTFGENELSFKPLNLDQIEKFSEDIDEDTDEFALSKSKRAGKALNCKIEQCGGRCLRNGESCRLTSSPDQKELWRSASGRNLATKVDTSLAKKRREMKAKRAEAAKSAEVKSAEVKPTPVSKPAKEKKQPAAKSKVHSVTKQEDFDDLVMHAHGKLAKENGGLVPIYKLRREVGELVPRNKFNDWLRDMQANDKLSLQGGGVEDSGPQKIQDSIRVGSGSLRTYAVLGDKGEQALEKASKRSKELDDKLKNRPELDPLGTAGELSKGAKIKSQSDFNQTSVEAYKRLNEEFNHDNLVPIADIRKAMGDRVSKKDFDDMLFELQSSDKFRLVDSSTASEELKKGGVSTAFGSRVYIQRVD